MSDHDGAASLVRSDALLAALKSYRCQYTVDHDGDSLPLVDALSPGETIAEGERELELLAEHLSLAIDEANAAAVGRRGSDVPTSGLLADESKEDK